MLDEYLLTSSLFIYRTHAAIKCLITVNLISLIPKITYS